MKQVLQDAATDVALRALQTQPINAVRNFLRTWLLGTMAAAGVIVAYTYTACLIEGDLTTTLMTQLPGVFLVLCMFLSVPVLALMIVKWIIWG